MTQLSPITLVYDQIALCVSDIARKNNEGQYTTKQDILEDFNKKLTEIYDKVNSPQSSLSLFVNGEPPSSSTFNSFINTLKDDINVSAKQLDFLNAKAISLFNLFAIEIEQEKKYVERIFSKTKVLEMYSSSPTNDLIYNGDSFDNGDYIDWEKIPVNQNPMITNGFVSLRIKENPTKWLVNTIKINPSNGFIGNNNLAIIKPNSVGNVLSSTYEYSFKDSSNSSNPANIADSNPATYFVYEAIRIEPNDSINRSQEEFSYIVDDSSLVNSSKNSLINWASHDMSKPLVLDFTLSSNTTQRANTINIIPFFDSSKIIKVKEIYITDSSGQTENILKEEFFIGLSIENLTKESFKNYSLNSGTFSFSERIVSKCRVVIEQPNFQDETILHTYWKTNYRLTDSQNTLFSNDIRFNAENLNKDLYSSAIYDKSQVIPKLTNPNEFKKDIILSKNLNILVKNSKNSKLEGLSEQNFSVPLRIAREPLPAKRMSIGIRDVSLYNQAYENSADIISKPYLFDSPVESVMLDVQSNSDNFLALGGYVKSYISLDEGKKWIEIYPVQRGFDAGGSSSEAIPEIITFNQNITAGFKLPGVQYMNHPKTAVKGVEYEIPNQVKNILVKIKITKGQSNATPVVYSYRLAAKVKAV